MKRVLVITNHWPPTGGRPVYRWLKLCKYLPEFGWQPMVFAPEPSDSDLVDDSLFVDVASDQQVVRFPVPAPSPTYTLAAKLLIGDHELFAGSRRPHSEDWTSKQQLFAWIHDNMLIPDARAPWVDPAVSFLTDYLINAKVSVVLSTGPPHSMHLVGQALARNLDLPWVADFRNPWRINLEEDHRIPPLAWSRKKHRRLRQSVIRGADALVVTAPTYVAELQFAGANFVEVLTDGFDYADLPKPRVLNRNRFIIHHSGDLTPDTNHEVFWEALRNVGRGVLGFQSNVEIELVGHVHSSVIEMAERYGFATNVQATGPSKRAEALDRMASAHVLLLPVDRSGRGPGQIPDQTYDYLAAGRPILAIGPREGDLARILTETRSGAVVEFDDYHGLKQIIDNWYRRFQDDSLQIDPIGREKYQSDKLAAQMAELLETVAGRAARLRPSSV